MQQQKICRTCHRFKHRGLFYVRAGARDGLHGECIGCLIDRSSVNQRRNLEGTRRNKRAWKLRHCDRVAAAESIRRKRAYPGKAEKHRARSRSYRLANAEKVKTWWKSEHGRMVRRLNQQRRSARLAAAPATLTREQWEAIIAAFGGLCAYACGRPWEEIDHVLALSRGGGLTANNVVPACGPCNVAKHARPFEAFCAARGIDPTAVLAQTGRVLSSA